MLSCAGRLLVKQPTGSLAVVAECRQFHFSNVHRGSLVKVNAERSMPQDRQQLCDGLRDIGFNVDNIKDSQLDLLVEKILNVHAGGKRGLVDFKFTRFWQELLARHPTPGSFLELPSDVALMRKADWGNTLLVRRCYRALFDRMVELLHSSGGRRKRHFLITGTSGIGKSFFAAVLMAWLVQEQNVSTIVYEVSGHVFLLTSHGNDHNVTEGTRADFRNELQDQNAWWIVDMGTANDDWLVEANIILLSSPDRNRYKEFLKRPRSTTLYMPVWGDDEIEACRSRLFPELDAAKVEALRAKWGNIPRYVLEQAEDESAQESLDSAIDTCKWEDVMQCIGQPDNAQPISHKLLHLDVVGDKFNRKVMKPASPYVVREIEKKAGEGHVRHLQELVQMSMSSTAYAAAAGVFFESYAHRRLQQGGSFNVRQLNSSRVDQAHQPVTQLNLSPASDIHEFSKLEDVKQQGDGIYCLPSVHNFPAVDSIMQPESMFQMTIAQKDKVNPKGLIAAGRQLRGPKRRLYFVVPGNMFKAFRIVADIPEDMEQWVLEVPWMR